MISACGPARLVSALGDRYDLVVIDTARTGVISDALPLPGQVDKTIVVVRMGQRTSVRASN